MRRRIDIEERKNEILNLYSENHSISKIAKSMNCDSGVIKRILEKNDVEIRPPEYYFRGKPSSKRLDLPEKEIISMYVNKDIPPSKIAKRFNCSNIVIYGILKRNKIGLKRTTYFKGRVLRDKINLQYKKIIEMYEKENLSGTQIAKKFNCNIPLIYKILKKNNVKMKGSKFFNKGQLPYNTGKERDEDIRKKISAKLQGISLKEWKNFNSFEPYDEFFNNKFKRAIRKRDNYVCLKCGKHQERLSRALDIHHINYDKKLSIPQNCISLCRNCHSEVNFKRKHWAKFFQSLLNEKYNYQYSENQEVIIKI